MFSWDIYKKRKKESGMLMLEATFLMTTVILLLIWILGLGFLYSTWSGLVFRSEGTSALRPATVTKH